jgi:RNA-directed DNA polymerase
MLHAAQKYGIPDAEAEYHNRYLKKHRHPDRELPSFVKVVKGKIDFLGMVRGKENPIYHAFYRQLAELAPDQIKIPIKTKPNVSLVRPLIITEGKTDWRHLRAALKRLNELEYPNLPEIDLQELGDNDPSGDQETLKHCEQAAKTLQSRPYIFMFDRDNKDILPKVYAQGSSYRNWGNNVFSFAIPVPSHREEGSLISIEFFYKDADLQKGDSAGRRLFLSSEFNPQSGRHLNMDLNCTERNKYQHADKVVVVDNAVFDKDHQNVALPKSKFAKYIFDREGEFADMDFSEFVKIFDVIAEIIRNHYTQSLAATNLP